MRNIIVKRHWTISKSFTSVYSILRVINLILSIVEYLSFAILQMLRKWIHVSLKDIVIVSIQLIKMWGMIFFMISWVIMIIEVNLIWIMILSCWVIVLIFISCWRLVILFYLRWFILWFFRIKMVFYHNLFIYPVISLLYFYIYFNTWDSLFILYLFLPHCLIYFVVRTKNWFILLDFFFPFSNSTYHCRIRRIQVI